MRRFLSVLGVTLLAGPAALAQAPVADPPLAGRPAEFSNVVGQYRLEAFAEPVAVEVEQPIRLRVRITGRGPAEYSPRREHLKLFPPDWDKDFYVEPEPDQPRPAGDAWEFAYRLTPKHAEVTEISGLMLSYYAPGPGYQRTFADAIPLAVKPKAPATLPAELATAVAAPSLIELEAIDLSEPAARDLTWLLTVALALIGPPALYAIAVFASGRRGIRVQRQSEAGAAAMAELRRADGGAPWRVVADYLGERFAIRFGEATPAELARLLYQRNLPRAQCRQVEAFFRASDAARFARSGTPVEGDLKLEAIRLVEALEAVPCVS